MSCDLGSVSGTVTGAQLVLRQGTTFGSNPIGGWGGPLLVDASKAFSGSTALQRADAEGSASSGHTASAVTLSNKVLRATFSGSSALSSFSGGVVQFRLRMTTASDGGGADVASFSDAADGGKQPAVVLTFAGSGSATGSTSAGLPSDDSSSGTDSNNDNNNDNNNNNDNDNDNNNDNNDNNNDNNNNNDNDNNNNNDNNDNNNGGSTVTASGTFLTPPKARVIVCTDVGNVANSNDAKDTDDVQSLVRLMVYANDMDIEGLIATSSWSGKTKDLDDRTTGAWPQIIERIVNAYGRVRNNLAAHASGYPSAAQLKSVIKRGVVSPILDFMGGNHMQYVGAGRSTAASQHIINVVDRSDSRPVWVLGWGKLLDLAQALYDVKRTRSTARVNAFLDKLRVYDIAGMCCGVPPRLMTLGFFVCFLTFTVPFSVLFPPGQDNAGAYIAKTFPRLRFLRSTRQFQGLSYEGEGTDLDMFRTSWVNSNIRNKGALGAVYPSVTSSRSVVEGDTPSFLYLLRNGLSHPDHWTWGTWGGRFTATKVRRWGWSASPCVPSV